MAAPIVHIEFKSSDFARTAAFYARLFDWQTQINATSICMKMGVQCFQDPFSPRKIVR